MSQKTTKRLIASGIAALLVIITIFSMVVAVPVGSIKIGMTMGAPNGIVYQPGTNFKVPFFMGTVKMTLQEQTYDFEGTARASDGTHIENFKAKVFFSLDPTKATEVFSRYTTNWEHYLIKNAADDRMKTAFTKFTAPQIYATREQVPEKCKELFNELLKDTGVTVSRVILVDYTFDATFVKAIEDRTLYQLQKESATAAQEKAAIENATALQKAQNDNSIALAAAENNNTIKKNNADAQAYENQKLAETFTEQNAMKLFLEKWNGWVISPVGSGGENGVNVLPADFFQKMFPEGIK